MISIHAPRAGGDLVCLHRIRRAISISIHATRAGGDSSHRANGQPSTDFNPRHPCGGRLFNYFSCLFCRKISIHATRAGGDLVSHELRNGDDISIHATRAGGDSIVSLLYRIKLYISIHATRAGGDHSHRAQRDQKGISIHATRAGGDPPCPQRRAFIIPFQSTPPVRGATCPQIQPQQAPCHFNPRHPCGGRQVSRRVYKRSGSSFQSTPPVRGATTWHTKTPPRQKFQSTPPVRGATS